MDIGKSRDNFDKNKKTRKCDKYNKVEHLTKDYGSEQKMKNRSIQKESDKKDNDK